MVHKIYYMYTCSKSYGPWMCLISYFLHWKQLSANDIYMYFPDRWLPLIRITLKEELALSENELYEELALSESKLFSLTVAPYQKWCNFFMRSERSLLIMYLCNITDLP